MTPEQKQKVLEAVAEFHVDKNGLIGLKTLVPLDEIRRLKYKKLYTSAPEVGWIKTSDRLPKHNQEVLCCDKWNVTTATFCQIGQYQKWDLIVAGDYAEDASFEPTHWMPLPDMPEKS